MELSTQLNVLETMTVKNEAKTRLKSKVDFWNHMSVMMMTTYLCVRCSKTFPFELPVFRCRYGKLLVFKKPHPVTIMFLQAIIIATFALVALITVCYAAMT